MTDATGATRRDGNLYSLPPLRGDAYGDLIAACDVVVTKPGYGIVADVLANRVPTLYVSRPGFREEPILARALEDEGRALEVPRAALERWELGPWLDRLLALDRPWYAGSLDGAAVAARRVRDVGGW
jgi:predicted glycosyltransferase